MTNMTTLGANTTARSVSSTAAPIETLDSNTSRLYTYVHPFLVLSCYTFSFRSLVADPVAVLLKTLVPLAILQILFAVTCLPPMGGIPAIKKHKPGEKKARVPGKLESGVQVKVIPALLSLLLSILAATPLLTTIIVLFGAPVTTHHSHTLLCGAHIALLSTPSLVYVHGVNGETWRRIVALLLPVDEVYGGLIGTLVGAWLGAVPIPLDWDREWQKWPITIVTGAYVGYTVGALLGGTLLKGKKVVFD